MGLCSGHQRVAGAQFLPGIMMNVDDFIALEVEAQKYIPGTPEFVQRIMWMHDAWRYAEGNRICPVCHGEGKQWMPGEAAFDVGEDNWGPHECNACEGRGFFYPHLHDIYHIGYLIEREVNNLAGARGTPCGEAP